MSYIYVVSERHRGCDNIFNIQYMILVHRLIFHRADKCPFKLQPKEKKKGLKALLFGASKELQGWQHSAW